mgnify:CR=1 FL=1
MLVPGELLTEGKGKRIYATEDPDKAIVTPLRSPAETRRRSF